MKLNEFRLESYLERSALIDGLLRVPADSFYKAQAEALLVRLSRTECQPGGCEYCGADRDEA